MKIITPISLFLMLLFSMFVNAQSLKKHKWKERVLLLMIDEQDNEVYHKQLAILRSDKEGLAERKLIVYSISPKVFATGIDNLNWKKIDELSKIFKRPSAPFEIILVGLDGGIKLKRDTILDLKELFSLIDAMPMRANELKQRGAK